MTDSSAHVGMFTNLSAILDAASDQDWTDGLYWYATANHEAGQMAADYGLSVEAAAGIVAALSPMMPWDRNVSTARTVVETGDGPAFKSNVRKALAIRSGAAPVKVLGGPKVRAFFTSILNPADRTAVCVDRHAYDAATGNKGASKSCTVAGRRYKAVADAYRAVADHYGLLPSQAQAIVWVAWRRGVRPTTLIPVTI